MFHVCLLKKAIGNYHVEQNLPLGSEGECTDVLVPAAVLAYRSVTKGQDTVGQLLIQWKGKSADEVTWEEFTIRSQFPDFNLGDKVAAEAAGSDRVQNNAVSPEEMLGYNMSKRTKIWKVYTRKRKG